MSVTVIATLHSQPGQRASLLALLEPLRQASLQEPGCLQYMPNLDPADADCVVMVEAWQDQPSLESHTVSAHFRHFCVQAEPLLACLEIRQLQPY
ncbi:putative quinol monooxygenase [Craterilacuibacter sp. RT1T]|uniref:putative quinol monooxygenase n=1 Tax=Craterilacuibacter sp. RT1T TaxID=2942211 RepID=UPI0020C0EA29|nr:putative quinol monooxygenase [Craterilacuibacter sp. RT1T]MCL6263634.1 antibiotic biosynthesis monooxygenase [Craterilacuibacter sp. RT1T]